MTILNKQPFINTGLFDDINKTNNQINSMNIPQAPQVPQVDPMVRRQRAGNMMLALSDVLRGQDPSQGVLQRQQMIAQQQQKAEQDKLNQELNAAIDSSNIPESQKKLMKSLNVQAKTQALMGTFEPEKTLSPSEQKARILAKVQAGETLLKEDIEILDILQRTDPIEIAMRGALGTPNIETDTSIPKNFKGTAEQWDILKKSNPTANDESLIDFFNTRYGS
jgi:hypothetical protein